MKVAPRFVRDVHRILRREFGPLQFKPGGNPLDELIATILSQNTTDKNSQRAYRSLRRAFPRWDNALRATPAAIATAIRQGGLANVKARAIRNVLALILKREGRLSLRRLGGMENREALDYLRSLPGVGIKTASCVLLFSLGRPVMPVDTHVFRVTRRLGWLNRRVSIRDAGRALEGLIPARLILPVHFYLVWHGRRTCKAQRPRCRSCPIIRHCSRVDVAGALV